MNAIKTFRQNIPKINLIIYLLFVFAVIGCSTDDGAEPIAIVESTPKEEIKLSSEKQITSFVFSLTKNPIEVNVIADLDEENKTIIITMPPETDLTGLVPDIEISTNATINPLTAQNFTDPLEYTVTAEDGSEVIYTVTVTALLSQRQILQTILDANPESLLDWDLQNTSDLSILTGISTNIEGAITQIALSNKNLSQFPPEIGQLTSLTGLFAINNNLTGLPDEIGQLTNLTRLVLPSNQLTTIPSTIGQLINLTELRISSNQLNTIPSTIGQLTNLTELKINSNQLTTIPSTIGQLTNLIELRSGNNQLTIIPPEIGQMMSLEILDFENNQLTTIPSTIGQLTNLRLLVFGINKLTSIPSEIGELTNLETLNFYDNQLTSLPSEIGKLTRLEILYLNNNQLTFLPPQIGFLTNLERLSTQTNNFSFVPGAICNLKSFNNPDMEFETDAPCFVASQKDALISIYSANPGNTLNWSVDNFPEVNFDANGNPKSITMNNKNLTRLPSLFELTELETLNVNSNNLENLPSSFDSLNKLITITAASNQLSTVPAELEQLTNLTLLSISNNPIISIPTEVCDLQTSNGGILTILTDPGEGCN